MDSADTDGWDHSLECDITSELERQACSVIAVTLVLPAVVIGFATFMVTDLDVGIFGTDGRGYSVIFAVGSWHTEQRFGPLFFLCISLGERSRKDVH
jgi:hypothetical protein